MRYFEKLVKRNKSFSCILFFCIVLYFVFEFSSFFGFRRVSRLILHNTHRYTWHKKDQEEKGVAVKEEEEEGEEKQNKVLLLNTEENTL